MDGEYYAAARIKLESLSSRPGLRSSKRPTLATLRFEGLTESESSLSKDATARALGPESRDRTARMQAIVDASVELFAADGYDGVSTRAIAERAGCSETLLFRYFGGKRGLLLAICNQMTDRNVERLRAVDYDDLETYLEEQLLGVIGHIQASAAELRIITAAIVSDDELAAEFEQRHDEAVDYMAEQLAHFQRAGAIAPDVDIVSIAAALEQMGFALGLLVQVVYGKPKSELAAIAAAMAHTLAVGMRGDDDAAGSGPWREEAVRVVRSASDDLQRLLGVLGGTGRRKR